MTDQPIAWGMPRPDGTILDVITPMEHAYLPGQYTVPLYARPQPKAEQEPVAWQWLNTANFRKKLPADANKAEWNPLYAAPQPRKRLTDQEIDAVWDTVPQTQFWWRRYARAIEAAVWGEQHGS
jgi:hypothetical protein